jgi:hypothetical protein
MNIFLSKEKSIRIAEYILKNKSLFSYDRERHKIVLYDDLNNEILHFRLPIHLSHPEKLHDPVHYLIVLVQSGSSSIGYFEDGININHKVITSYMVRMKQGKSQIKYLKTKGKSRAGSRVRLSETMEFFENINERLQDQFKLNKIDRIAMSCSKILIPYLYNSKIPCPFEKKDARLVKIPKHVETPNFEILLKINDFMQKGELIYEPTQQQLADDLLSI